MNGNINKLKHIVFNNRKNILLSYLMAIDLNMRRATITWGSAKTESSIGVSIFIRKENI